MQSRGIRNERVLPAFRDVPRDAFVSPIVSSEAYADRALPIACRQTISQPYVLELLVLSENERVLEIGTGSGYQNAILAQLAGQVYSIQQHAWLSEKVGQVLEQLEYNNIELRVGEVRMLARIGSVRWDSDNRRGTSRSGPLAGTSGDGGGPIGNLEQQNLVLVERAQAGKLREAFHGGVRFVPLMRAFGGTAQGLKTKKKEYEVAKNKLQGKKKEEKLFVDGQVIESLPNRMFRVVIGENKQEKIIGYLSGKMTKNYIRVTIGDWVRVEFSPYDLSKGRIVFRYSKPPRK